MTEPLLVVTMTSYVIFDDPAGVINRAEVSLIPVTSVAATPPIVTPMMPVNFVPVMVTVSPPAKRPPTTPLLYVLKLEANDVTVGSKGPACTGAIDGREIPNARRGSSKERAIFLSERAATIM